MDGTSHKERVVSQSLYPNNFAQTKDESATVRLTAFAQAELFKSAGVEYTEQLPIKVCFKLYQAVLRLIDPEWRLTLPGLLPITYWEHKLKEFEAWWDAVKTSDGGYIA
jgi:hypothetical protein